jgi:hypothetical protein
VPGLGDEPDLDRKLVLADGIEKRLQLSKSALRIGTGRLEKNLELDVTVTELNCFRISSLLCHGLFPRVFHLSTRLGRFSTRKRDRPVPRKDGSRLAASVQPNHNGVIHTALLAGR